MRIRVGDVTAEPRMEDLLASIRKAIHEDIGDGPGAGLVRIPLTAEPAVRTPRGHDRVAPPPQMSDIDQLREKISRARAKAPSQPPAEPARRAASLAAALQSETPRRNWRDLEPPPLPGLRPAQTETPRLRGSVVEPEPVRPAAQPMPARVDTPPARVVAREEAAPLISGGSAQVVQSAFNKLAESVLARSSGAPALEDMTREMLRGMLKQWLDDNLPAMVERMVREEIERVARTGR